MHDCYHICFPKSCWVGKHALLALLVEGGKGFFCDPGSGHFFRERTNQTLRQTTLFGLCEFACAKQWSHLGNLRESVFPLGVFHFAPYSKPRVENLQVSLKHIDQTGWFSFHTIIKTENSELKTLEFSLRHINQILRFSNSEFSVLGIG